MHGEHHGPHALHDRDHLGELCEHLRQEHIQLIEIAHQVAQFIGQRINTVECVEYRSHGPAQRNVEAVWFPVQIIADRSEEVVEIRDVIPQFVGDFLHFMRAGDHVML